MPGMLFEPSQVIFETPFYRVLSDLLRTGEVSTIKSLLDATLIYDTVEFNKLFRQNSKKDLERLLICACYADNEELVEYLLSIGVDPHSTSVHGSTAIMYLAENDNLKMVKRLASLVDPFEQYYDTQTCTILGIFDYTSRKSETYAYLKSLQTKNKQSDKKILEDIVAPEQSIDNIAASEQDIVKQIDDITIREVKHIKQLVKIFVGILENVEQLTARIRDLEIANEKKI
jgi:hypothetical protein